MAEPNVETETSKGVVAQKRPGLNFYATPPVSAPEQQGRGLTMSKSSSAGL